VVCGFGRTGRWFGQEHFGFQPDFMTLAKAITSGYLPLGAVMVADSVADVLINDGGEFAHGYTYSGHPAVCAAALANIAILRDEHLVDRCREDIGPYLQARWRELADHPLVGEARGVGMIGALELVADKASRRFFPKRGAVGTLCRDHCFREGLVMRAVRDTMIISPPLILTREHVDELVTKAHRCLDLTLADARTGAEIDMGSGYDLFDPVSWPSDQTIGPSARANRMLLQDVMLANGFRPLKEEWWHFTLRHEPYPETYFDFPVR
jgi:putrescine aminotransferase